MKRILIVGNNDTGLYNFRKELIQKLIEEGHEVYFSVPQGGKVGLIEQLGAIYYPIHINRRSLNPFQEIALLAKYNITKEDNKVSITKLKDNNWIEIGEKTIDNDIIIPDIIALEPEVIISTN